MKDVLFDKLLEMVVHAYTTVPFYRELLGNRKIDLGQLLPDAFGELPLVDKSMIIGRETEMLSDVYKGYANSKKLSIQRTSGSSGHYLKVYWDVHDETRSLMGLWYRRKEYFGITPSDKYCYFYTTQYARNRLLEAKDVTVLSNGKAIGFCKNNMSSQRIDDIYAQMLRFEPKWIMMQPSIALLLSKRIAMKNFPPIPSIEYIELTGEYLTDQVRYEIEQAFQCTVANQYGCNEANSIASECNNKKMHVHASSVYVEVLREGKAVPFGEAGDIYITSLNNRAMPFIRYKIGERGILYAASECSCRCKDTILELINGRECELISTDGGEEITAYVFLKVVEYINEKVGNIILQFQVVQTDINQFTVKLVIKPSYMGWRETISDLFVDKLEEEALKNAKWEFVYREELLPDGETGKLAYFINEYKKKRQE